jgi:hypothetical protein
MSKLGFALPVGEHAATAQALPPQLPIAQVPVAQTPGSAAGPQHKKSESVAQSKTENDNAQSPDQASPENAVLDPGPSAQVEGSGTHNQAGDLDPLCPAQLIPDPSVPVPTASKGDQLSKQESDHQDHRTDGSEINVKEVKGSGMDVRPSGSSLEVMGQDQGRHVGQQVE